MIITDASAGLSRRTLLQGLGSLFAAPAIVRIDSLMAMPRRPLILPGDLDFYPCDGRLLKEAEHPALFKVLGKLDRRGDMITAHLATRDPATLHHHLAWLGRQYGGSPDDGTFALPDFSYEAAAEMGAVNMNPDGDVYVDPVRLVDGEYGYELDRHGTLYEVRNGVRVKIG